MLAIYQFLAYIMHYCVVSYHIVSYPTDSGDTISVGAQSTLGDKAFLPENMCMKN